ncbi:MAG: hypothetical protein ACLGIA_01020 [Actinomycetes bacterium]
MSEHPTEHEAGTTPAPQSVDDHPRTVGETEVDDAIGTSDDPS